MKLQNIIKPLGLATLGTVASAQVATANPILRGVEDTRLIQTICTATQRKKQNESIPLTEWSFYTTTIEEAQKACQQKVDDFTRAIENSNNAGTPTGIIPDRIEDNLTNPQTGESYYLP